jgi:hypothetical protein
MEEVFESKPSQLLVALRNVFSGAGTLIVVGSVRESQEFTLDSMETLKFLGKPKKVTHQHAVLVIMSITLTTRIAVRSWLRYGGDSDKHHRH